MEASSSHTQLPLATPTRSVPCDRHKHPQDELDKSLSRYSKQTPETRVMKCNVYAYQVFWFMVSCITRLRYMLSTRLHMSTCSSRSDFSSLAASRRKTLEELVMKTCKEKDCGRSEIRFFFIIIPQTELYWFEPHKEHFISVASLDFEPLVTCTPEHLDSPVVWPGHQRGRYTPKSRNQSIYSQNSCTN